LYKITEKLNVISKASLTLELLCLAIYLIFCIIFYQERTLFLDNAYQTFLLIQDREIVVNANRWPVVVLRVLPLMVVKLGGSIKLILLAFSLSYALFQLAIYFIIRVANKDRHRSWMLLALMVLPVAHSFYWCNSELITGLSLVVLFVSCIEVERHIYSVILLLILPWVHPLILVLVGFVLAYYFIFHSDYRYRSFLFGVLYIGMTLIKSVFFQNWYDKDKNRILTRQIREYAFADHNLDYIFQSAFWPIILSVFICIALCFYFRRYWVLLYYVTTSCAYLLLQDIMIRNYDNVFYHEVSYLLLFLWSVFVIHRVGVILPAKTLKVIGFVLFTIGFTRIFLQGSFYSDRIDWYQEILQHQDRKVITYDKSDYPQLVMEWGSPYESLLISSMDGPSKTIMFAENPSDFITDDPVFVSHFGMILLDEIDQEYFDLKYKPYSIDGNN